MGLPKKDLWDSIEEQIKNNKTLITVPKEVMKKDKNLYGGIKAVVEYFLSQQDKKLIIFRCKYINRNTIQFELKSRKKTLFDKFVEKYKKYFYKS